MSSPSVLHLLAVVFVSAIAGAMNAVAGGGTLLTFPALIGLGIPPLVANATSTVALVPGSAGSIWGYRGELAGARKWAIGFALPSFAGGLVGALLLLATDASTFSALVPWLVLGATGLFIAQGPLNAWLRRRGAPVAAANDDELTSRRPAIGLMIFQFAIGIYGGYFGAGVGILMLAALGLMGLTNIHRMNGLKNFGGVCMNAVAAMTFAISGLVNWPVALSMAVGATGGGYLGSRTAQRVSQKSVRMVIVSIGLASGIWLLLTR